MPGLRIQVAGSLVQQQDLGIFQQGPGDGDALALSPGELTTLFAHISVKAVFAGLDKVVYIGIFCRQHQFLVCESPIQAIGHVAADGAGEHGAGLGHIADGLPPGRLAELPGIHAPQCHPAALRVIKSLQQTENSALASAAGTDQGGGLTGRQGKADVLEDRVYIITEGNILKFQVANLVRNSPAAPMSSLLSTMISAMRRDAPWALLMVV